MKGIKKIIFTAAALFAAITVIGSTKASAAGYSVGLNEEKSFSVSGSDEDVIEFQAPKTGSFHVEIVLTDTVKDGKSVKYDNVTLKATMTSNYKDMWTGLNIGKGDGWISSPEYCLSPGSRITLKVNGNFTDTTFIYSIKIVNKADKFFEKEKNNSARKATAIKLKKNYSGVINDADDTDWFVFKAPQTRKYTFRAVNTTDHHDWTAFTGYKSKNKADGSYTSVYNASGWKKIKTVSLKKGQKYYIQVKKGYSSNATYKIKVK